MRSRKKSLEARVLKKLRNAAGAAVVLSLAYAAILSSIDPPVTWTQIESWATGRGLSRDYVSLDRVSDHAKLAVMAAEDQTLAAHSGFDWNSIARALRHNRQNPDRIRGGSTISQQVAKNVFLWQGQSWLRKGLESYFTVLIELFWSKERILEVYLNVAEMGPGIFGIEAASRHYFGKSAEGLTKREAALIAACLPSPKKRSPVSPSRSVRAKAEWIIAQMGVLRSRPEVARLVR